jgi:RNA polymerase sigma factor (sigma-70 family)
MAQLATSSVVRQIAALFQIGSMAGLPDRQLLERYATGGGGPTGEAAFAALVARHGPMVLGVCREILGDFQHAEDAFQAVFLVLAREARTIRDPDLLGNWLYGVAIRTARCARRKVARSRRREEGDAMKGVGSGSWAPVVPTGPPADRPAIAREQAEALHEEVARLPRAFRAPVVLCYFEGLTIDQAARRLRCPAGTLHSRLARAKEKLRIGLARRGVILPAAALAALLAPRSVSASVPPLLCETTTRAAIAFAARSTAAGGALSALAAALAQEVLRTMIIHKLRLVVITALALAAVATGAGWLARALAMKEEPVKEPTATPEVVGRGSQDPARTPDRRSPAPDGARMTVAGRVLDPDGKPVEGAAVDVIGAPRTPRVAASEDRGRHTLLGQGRSGGDGRFWLDVPRTASARVHELGLIAAAPGYGLGWANLNPDDEQPTADVRLQPEQVIRARLVDVIGAPARGVEVRVLGLWRPDALGPRPGRGVWVADDPPQGARTWPRAVKSDEQGRIALAGIGRGLRVSLQVRDIPYARQDLYIDSGKLEASKEPIFALQPGRIIEGRVLAADTGRPIPNAVVSASTQVRNEHASGIFTIKSRADDQGRFLLNPIAGKLGYMRPDVEGFVLGAFPTGGEPYLIQQDEVPWTKGAVKATRDIKLKRGVLIRGKVSERGNGRPLPASSIQFMPVRGGNDILSGWQAIVASGDDASYQIAVPPGKGHLLVFGPTGDYVLTEIGSEALYDGQQVRSTRSFGGLRYRAHAILPYEVKAGDPPHELAASLKPGATIRGRVEGPDGQTVTDATIITTLLIEAINPSWRGDFQIPVRDGRFELHGVDPQGSARIHVLDPEHEWGATLVVSGRQAGEDLTVRLQPCGKALGRIVGPDGETVARHRPYLEFVATPGPSRFTRDEKERAELSADADNIANVDRKHYWNGPTSDAEGRFTLPSLIPGALYRIIDFSRVNDPNTGIRIRKDFTVKPGETVDLGEIVIEKPEAR